MPPKRKRRSVDPLLSLNQTSKPTKLEKTSNEIDFMEADLALLKAEETPTETAYSGDELMVELPERGPERKLRERGTYSRYEKDDLLEAVKMFKSKKMSLNMAAKYYNVPKTTICNYSMNGDREHSKRGVEPTLKPEEEQHILTWLMDGSDLGDPRTNDELIQAAADVLRISNRSSVFKNGIPTHAWIKTFKNRHKSCVILRNLNGDFSEGAFFRKFYTFLEKNDYLDVLNRPDAFYFIEDTNLELDIEKISSERRMLLRKSMTKGCTEPSSFRLEKSVTVTYGFGADGRVLPQLLIFRDSFNDMVNVAVADQQLKAKFLFARTHDGGNTRDTFRCYLERIDAQLRDVERPIFIFCGETLPRVGVELSQWCVEKRIHIVSFIPNDTSILQAIDKTVFGFKNVNGWIMEIKNFQKENKLVDFTEVDFVKALKSMNDRIIAADRIKECFLDSGVFPFDTAKMDDVASDAVTEEDDDDARKTDANQTIQKMYELNRELMCEMTKLGRENLLLNVRIIEQQLQFIESCL